MKRFILPCITGVCLLAACATHHPQPSISSHDSLAEQDSLARKDSGKTPFFFPVADYLKSEIRRVDSLPVALKLFTTRAGHTDSAFISVAEFDKLARQFLPAELEDGSFEKKFTETSFIDNASRNATFTYSTTDNSLPLQRVDVLTVPGTSSNHVKSIYLEKDRTAGDSVILQKLYWNGQERLQIVTMIRIHGMDPKEQLTSVVWGIREDD
jgi:hypothetical protein